MSDNSADRYRWRDAIARRRTVVVAEEPTDALPPPNGAGVVLVPHAVNQVVAETLMIAFAMIVDDELREREYSPSADSRSPFARPGAESSGALRVVQAGASGTSISERSAPGASEESYRRNNRGNLRHDPATETRAEDSQAAPFVVRQLHALIAQLRLWDAILFAQVLDHLVLFVLEPAEERRDD